MGQALYRRYRSKTLDEIVGQEHITTTLQNAIKTNRISHAYLFTGPRGVGKTSIARILAHEINKLPYTDDTGHVDIIEIDAASNRRIDEIREIREKVFTAPTSATYKVYIIDEVHMLTKEAFNALLKTLEEPPAHVVFILATTDAHKLPQTIVSRTQRYNFRPVGTKQVAAHLKSIAKQEKIKISDDALELLARHGEGSFRDSISMLDQISSTEGAIDVDTVQNLLGLPSDESIAELLNALLHDSNPSEVALLINSLFDQGFQASIIAKQLGAIVRERCIREQPTERIELLHLLERLIEVPASRDPDRMLEIALLKTSFTHLPNNYEPATITISDREDVEKQSLKAPSAQISPPQPSKAQEITHPVKAKQTEPITDKGSDDDTWRKVLHELKVENNTLYGIIRMADARITDKSVELTFSFNFHKKRIEEAANQQKLADIIKTVTGRKYSIVCIVDEVKKPKKPTTPTPQTKTDPQLATISNIFGGGELLES